MTLSPSHREESREGDAALAETSDQNVACTRERSVVVRACSASGPFPAQRPASTFEFEFWLRERRVYRTKYSDGVRCLFAYAVAETTSLSKEMVYLLLPLRPGCSDAPRRWLRPSVRWSPNLPRTVATVLLNPLLFFTTVADERVPNALFYAHSDDKFKK